ncbi:DBF4-type zinc finger-containing protein 2 isoform X2 [Ambystoma mexicanum]
MLDINEFADRVSDSSSKGPCLERRSTEGPKKRKRNRLRAQLQHKAEPGVTGMQRKRGYCTLCRAHYRSLEQHLLNPQHRHFATYNRNHIGSVTLMERFLHDVRQYHPQSYHDNRPTHDDLPDTHCLRPRQEDSSSVSTVCLLPKEEKETVGTRKETSATDSESLVISCSSIRCRTKSSLTNNSVSQLSAQTPQKGPKSKSGRSQKEKCTFRSIDMCVPSRTTNQNALVTAASVLPHSTLNSSDRPILAQKIPSSASQIVSVSKSAQGNVDKGNAQNLLANCFRPGAVFSPLGIPAVSHWRSGYTPNSTLPLTPGVSIWKHVSSKSQGESVTSDVHLRDVIGAGFLYPESSDHICKDGLKSSKAIGWSSSHGTSVDEIIEEVILKHCYGIPPRTFSCQEKEADLLAHLKPLLDDSNIEGSDISFNVETPIQSGAAQPIASVKDLDFLKEAQVTLEDTNYESHLHSVLNACPVQVTENLKTDKWICSVESVLPALPHVPPSFVGKTWSQVMHEDDLKIEALVRDFREGRFHCHFDSDSLTTGRGKSSQSIKKPRVEESMLATSIFHDSASANALPAFSDDICDVPGSLHPSVTSDTLCKPSPMKNPVKRTWRLASRCQTVKVSHGTQTSVVNYPVVKRKIIRQDSEISDGQGRFDWLEDERTPDMKTRLCALKLPQSYTKLLSPVQPKNMVYVLSHPEINPCRVKPARISRASRNHHSTDSKNSVTYKYKQCPLKYYDPLTNRVLKVHPSSSIRGKAKRNPCVRQLFRSISFDVNMSKLDDLQQETTSSKMSFGNVPSTLCTAKKDFNLGVKGDRFSNSADKSENLMSCDYVKPCRSIVLSPLNTKASLLDGNLNLAPLVSGTLKGSKTSLKHHLLQEEKLKSSVRGGAAKGKGSLSKIASVATTVRHGISKIDNKVAQGKTWLRTKAQSRKRTQKKPPVPSPKTSFLPVIGCQTRIRSVEKRPNQGKQNLNKSQRAGSPKKMVLRSSTNVIARKPTVPSKSAPEQLEVASVEVEREVLNASDVLPRTTRRTKRPTLAH